MSIAVAVSGICRVTYLSDDAEALAQTEPLPDANPTTDADADAGPVRKIEVRIEKPAVAASKADSATDVVNAYPVEEGPELEVVAYKPAEIKGVIDSRPVAVPIPGTIRQVEWRELRNDKRIKIAGLKGYAVEESDTARQVWLRTTRGWLNAMDLQIRSDFLIVNISFDKFAPLLDSHHTVRTAPFVVATLVVPKGMLRSASVGGRTLYVNMFKAKEFDATSNDRIVLNHSNIDRLNSLGNSLSELKLDFSTVQTADIYRVRNRFTLECTSKASSVRTLYIEGVRVGRFATVNLEKANIGQLRWNPADTGITVRVLSTVPVNTILPPTKSSGRP